MSQRRIGVVIDRLLADRDFRVRFANNPIDTLAELCFVGIELTADEIDLFCRTDWRLWFWGSTFVGNAAQRAPVFPLGICRVS